MKLPTFTDNWMGNQCVKFYVITLYNSWKISKILYGDTFLALPVYTVHVALEDQEVEQLYNLVFWTGYYYTVR